MYVNYSNHIKCFECRVSLILYPTKDQSTIMCHLTCGMIYARNSFGSRFLFRTSARMPNA